MSSGLCPGKVVELWDTVEEGAADTATEPTPAAAAAAAAAAADEEAVAALPDPPCFPPPAFPAPNPPAPAPAEDGRLIISSCGQFPVNCRASGNVI